jgi:outer membrane immunogenic protein
MTNAKRLLVASAVFSAVGFSSAAVAAPEVFVGGQLGYQDTSLKLSDAGVTFDGVSISGVAGSLFAGVKYPLDGGFFIGAEANVGTSGADAEISLFDITVEADAKTSYGAAALLGYQVTDATALYGRLGYQRTEYELTVREPGFSVSDDETFGGVRFGIGMESELTEQLALRLDWSQTHYSSKDFDGEKFEPTESLFQVGAVFKF